MLRVWNTLISKITDEKNRLAVILIVGLIHGLIYVFVTPPWWHHDEAGHFQVARFIADHNRRPEWGEVDEEVQQELILSLDENGVFDYINYQMDSNDKLPHWVLALQVNDPPLYYSVASVPLRIFKNSNVNFQNRVLRLLSLVFFLLTLWVSWELAGEIFGEWHPLRSISTVFLAMLPGFLNEMTAITNAALGTLLFSLFLLMGVKLLKDGFSWLMLTFFIGSAIAAYYTNNLVWVSLVLITPGVILFLLFSKRFKWLPWIIILFVALVTPFVLFEWREARYWYGNKPIEFQSRQFDEESPFGEYVLKLPGNHMISQRIPAEILKPLRSKTITLGFWAWASTPSEIDAPQLIFSIENEHLRYPKEKLFLDLTPTFYAIEIDVPQNSGRGWLQISPVADKDLRVYFDQMVLVDGEIPEGLPQFDDPGGKTGEWQGSPFVNLIRNASFEETWMSISAFAWNKLLYRFNAYFSSPALATLLDWESSDWYFKQTFIVFNETFWGKFGPSTVPILGAPYLYQALRIMLLIGIIGMALFLWKKIATLKKQIIFTLGLGVFILWGQALLRGASSVDSVDSTLIVIPWARYALPAFLPTVLFLNAGWFTGLRYLAKKLGNQNMFCPTKVIFAFMLTLDLFALLTMLQFFYLQTQWFYLVFFMVIFLALSALWLKGTNKELDLSQQRSLGE
jgi:hypothetical protein